MHPVAQRWFDPNQTANLVSSVAKTCLRAAPLDLDDQSQQRDSSRLHITLMAMGAALAFLVVLQVFMECFAERLPGKEPNYIALAMIWLVVVGGAGLLTFFISGRNNQQRGKRDLGFAALASSNPTLRCVSRFEMPEHFVGRVPWFMSEEFSTLNGIACGMFQGVDLCLVEGGQIVDPVLATTDSQLAVGAMALVNRKQKRIYKNDFDAVMFLQPLPNIPDMVIVTKRDPNRGYFKRALVKQGCEVDLKNASRKFRSKYWVGSADPNECQACLTPELESLLDKMPKGIVQVVGGFCIVIPAQWRTTSPGQAPKSESELAENLQTASAVYKSFSSASSSGLSVPQTSYDSDSNPSYVEHQGAVATMAPPAQSTSTLATTYAEPTMVQSSAADSGVRLVASSAPSPTPQTGPRRGKRARHGWFALLILFGLGLPMLLLGGAMSVVMTLDKKNAESCQDWPTTNGFVTKSTIETSGNYFKPIIEYKYRVDGKNYDGDRVRFGWKLPSEDRGAAEKLVSQFPRGKKAVVYFNDDNPNFSALEPGLQNPRSTQTVRNQGFVVFFLGLLFCGKGFRGKRRRKSAGAVACRPCAEPTAVR